MPPKKRTKKKSPATSPRLSLFKSLFWICIVLLTGLTLFVAMRLPLRQTPVTPGGAPAEQRNQEQPAAHAGNPAARKLVELARWPTSTWAQWETELNKDKSDRALAKLGEAWIAENQATFDNWVAEAAKAVTQYRDRASLLTRTGRRSGSAPAPLV